MAQTSSGSFHHPSSGGLPNVRLQQHRHTYGPRDCARIDASAHIDSGPRCPEEISTSRGVPHLASKDPTRYDVYRESPLPILENATQKHCDLACGRPLKYLKGTITDGLVFQPGNTKWFLSGASDSDLAGDLNSARTTTGYYAKLGDYGAVVCNSHLERKICTSTGQGETYAMQSLTKEVVWDRHLLHELHHGQESRTPLLTDNDGVMKQSTKAINHSTAKHYRIAQAYIRSKVDDGTIEVGSVDTSLNRHVHQGAPGSSFPPPQSGDHGTAGTAWCLSVVAASARASVGIFRFLR